MWTENRATSGWRRVDLAELWRYRELVVFLARRDLSVRYKQTVFGAAWALLQPLFGAVIFTFVFRQLAHVSSGAIPYPVFAYIGFMAWTYLSGSITTSTESLVTNVQLVTKVYFPRLAAPVAAVVPGLVDLAVSSLLLVVFLVVYRVAPGAAIVTLPLFLVLLVALALGVGLWLSTLHVKYRDARHATGLLLQLWLFVSPIAYPPSLVGHQWRWLYGLNPVVGIVSGLRWSIAGGPLRGSDVASSVVVTAIVLVTGCIWFARAERAFADVI
jgi:ABC-type polysaccharide/polyol phosphate export permease